MGRRAARDTTMKLLYQMEIHKGDIGQQVEESLSAHPSENDRNYIKDVVTNVIEKKQELDNILENYLKAWKINRISKIDLSILRIAIYEMHYREDIPVNVSINEAVELAKKYSTEQSASYINGILSKLYTEIKEKTGED